MSRQTRNPVKHDFGLPTSQPLVSAHMPSLSELTRQETTLTAGRDALAIPGRNPTSGMQQNPQFASLQQGAFDSLYNRRDSLQWRGFYEPTPLMPGHRFYSGLQNRDMSLLLQKQQQALSLATASQQQQQGGASPLLMSTMRQCQSLEHQISVLESVLARQEGKRHCKRSFDDSFSSTSPKERPAGLSSLQKQLEQRPYVPQLFDMTQSVQKERKRTAKKFPVKLMGAIMANYDENIVAWLPDGRSFVVVNPDLFVDTVLKQTFKGCKYASFVRKLNRWGFRRLASGADCFFHPLFQRERIDICAQILCVPRNESAKKRQVPPTSTASTTNPILPMDAASFAPRDHPSLVGVEKFFNVRNEYAVRLARQE